MKKSICIYLVFAVLLNTFHLAYANDGNDRWFEEKETVSGYSHSFFVVGDTQVLTEKYHADFPKIYDWILDNAKAKKAEYVFGVGDICQYSTQEEWEVAKDGISRLDGKISYSLAKGSENHDASSMLNRYFCNDVYKDGFGGFYKDNQIENAWRVFRAGNIDYLNIVLEFGASDDILNWAAGIIESHPYHRVIVNTHCYLYSDGTLQNYTHNASPHSNETGNGTKNNGDEIWEKLISKYENIFMVLCGHYASEEIVINQRQGIHGNLVTEMLVNPQDLEAEEGAAGMVATLYFSEDGKTMDIEYYSTVRNKYFLKKNQRSLEIPEYKGARVKYIWNGLNSTDKLLYDASANLVYGAFILQPSYDDVDVSGFAYINERAGGKNFEDFYLKFDYKGSDSHSLLYHFDEEKAEFEDNYIIFKYNIFGNDANLHLNTRISGEKNLTLYQLHTTEKHLLKADTWNTCLTVVDTKSQKCFGYVNGIQTHSEDLFEKLLEADATYTDLVKAGAYRFELCGYDVTGDSDEILIDNLCVVSSPYVALPEDAKFTSDSVIYGDYLLPVNKQTTKVLADKSIVMIYNSESGWRRNADVACCDETVSIENDDTLYGIIYKNYSVSDDIKNKFYDGSSVPSDFTDYGFKFSAAKGIISENNQLGGKQISDYYATISTGSGDQTAYTNKNNTFNTRYCAMSFNIYDVGLKEIFARVNGNVKPRLLTNTYKKYLATGRWNNVFIVFDSITNNCKSYINGEFVYECNLLNVTEEISGVERVGDSFTYNGTDITSLVNVSDIRICFANNTVVYFDDYATLYTDFEPVPFNKTLNISAEDAVVKKGLVIIDSGKDSAKLVIPGYATSMVCCNSVWSKTDIVNIGDEVMLVKNSPYGNIYDLENYIVCSSDKKQIIASQDNGMTFVQGGYPWIPDENGTVVNESGIVGTNINQTGVGNDVLVTDRDNVFGSKMIMKELTVGYNSKTSYKTRYQADWEKSVIGNEYSYLVLEADIAFPSKTYNRYKPCHKRRYKYRQRI